MSLTSNEKIVMTLDAGGTNFVFSAIADGREIVNPVHLPAHGHDLPLCLNTIIQGFEEINRQLPHKPFAISFAFPGPADYRNGIIGDLANLPGFRGGVALGPMLEDHFQIPVYINNDGDLFTFGEARFGFLPALNRRLKEIGSSRQYRNLFGVTLGTGFGGGLVINDTLYLGENGAASEICLTQNAFDRKYYAEESISARAIIREYLNNGGEPCEGLTPQDIYSIATGEKHGNREAALRSFETFGEALGAALVNAITLLDCPVVIGGGLANAWPLFAPKMLEYFDGQYLTHNGRNMVRLVSRIVNFEDNPSMQKLAAEDVKKVKIPFNHRLVDYYPNKINIVGRSLLGTSTAVALGAYAFALQNNER
ncbi:MAG: ROK family protein [Bacteroidales bacterium]